MIDWNDYYYFALIADEGSYSQAALRAGVSKSVLSRRMTALEERLGVRLIQRTTRRLALTAAGEQFAVECRALVAQGERARAVVMAAQESPQGMLRVSAPVFMAETWFGEFVSEFIARWPLTKVQLLAINRPVDMVAEGIDIALVTASGALADSTLHYKKLHTQTDILVASSQWLARHPQVKAIDDLNHVDGILRLANNDGSQWQLINGEQEITLHPEARLQSNNLRVMLQAVLGGNGVALLPQFACKQGLANGELVRLFAPWSGIPRPLYALFAGRKGMPAIARYFMDELTTRLANGV